MASQIQDFHAHIYFDPPELAKAQALAAAARKKFEVPVGHFHVRPVGPHPRGSVQMTRTTRLRRTILHLRQIFLTEAWTRILVLLTWRGT